MLSFSSFLKTFCQDETLADEMTKLVVTTDNEFIVWALHVMTIDSRQDVPLLLDMLSPSKLKHLTDDAQAAVVALLRSSVKARKAIEQEGEGKRRKAKSLLTDVMGQLVGALPAILKTFEAEAEVVRDLVELGALIDIDSVASKAQDKAMKELVTSVVSVFQRFDDPLVKAACCRAMKTFCGSQSSARDSAVASISSLQKDLSKRLDGNKKKPVARRSHLADCTGVF